jgi:DNA invertase Pin-like site-specific DNA recombinase
MTTETTVIGIVRQSASKDNSLSPGEQESRLRAACERDGKRLLRVYRELDVSGGSPLAKRPGLREAVAAVEAGDADEIMAAYFDRLFRSLKTQAEVTERVEAAGGKLLALDVGQITNGTVGQWMSAQTLGLMSEYYRRSVKERTDPMREQQVADGKMIWPTAPWGYLVNDDRTLRVDEQLAPAIREAFARRAAGESIQQVRQYLAEQGHRRSYRQMQIMLKNPAYVGELRFGDLVNRRAWDGIVDERVWKRVQAMRVPSGRTAKSERLLARLGVLRCDGCGSRMVAGGQVARWGDTTRRYAFYKCSQAGHECPAPSAIAAERIEEFVSDHVRAVLADAEERESAVRDAVSARAAADEAELRFKRARRRLATDETVEDAEVAEILGELREAWDTALSKAEDLERDSELAESVNAARDWDRLTLAERRGLIRATVAEVRVKRGRGPVEERVVVHPVR